MRALDEDSETTQHEENLGSSREQSYNLCILENVDQYLHESRNSP